MKVTLVGITIFLRPGDFPKAESLITVMDLPTSPSSTHTSSSSDDMDVTIIALTWVL